LPKRTDQEIQTVVEQWLEKAVIGLELCPFARTVWRQGKIRFALSDAVTDDGLLQDLYDECVFLENHSDIETTLLILPTHLTEFSDFNDFLSLAEALLVEFDWQGIFQIASFHPQYQFANTAPDDRENYSNRSPYPILHLLRESSLERAVASHPAPASIPENNIARLDSLDDMSFKRIFGVDPSVED